MRFFGEPYLPEGSFATGPVPTFGELFSAAREQALYVDNINAAGRARVDAYDQRIQAIREATGVTLQNPLTSVIPEVTRQRESEGRPIVGVGVFQDIQREQETWFASRLQALATQFPDAAAAIAADRPVRADATALAHGAEERFTTLASRTRGGGAIAPALAGAIVGMGEDPVSVASLVIGGGAARSILQTAIREAVANAAIEAAGQPIVQRWRAEAGLQSGLGPALRNVGTAALFGAGGGALFGAAGAVARRFGRTTPELPPDHPLAGVERGDLEALATVAETLRRENVPLPPSARAAADIVAAERAAVRQAPEGVAVPEHVATVNEATRFAEDPMSVLPPTAERPLPAAEDVALAAPARFGAAAPDIPEAMEAAGRVRAPEATAQPPRATAAPERSPEAPASEADITAAREALRGATDVLEAARILRSTPRALDQSVPRNSDMVRTAEGVARLSDEAFNLVQSSAIDPRHAAVIGRRVPDRTMHAPLVRAVSQAVGAGKIKNTAQGERVVGQMVNHASPASARSDLMTAGQPMPRPAEATNDALGFDEAEQLDDLLRELGEQEVSELGDAVPTSLLDAEGETIAVSEQAIVADTRRLAALQLSAAACAGRR